MSLPNPSVSIFCNFQLGLDPRTRPDVSRSPRCCWVQAQNEICLHVFRKSSLFLNCGSPSATYPFSAPLIGELLFMNTSARFIMCVVLSRKVLKPNFYLPTTPESRVPQKLISNNWKRTALGVQAFCIFLAASAAQEK